MYSDLNRIKTAISNKGIWKIANLKANDILLHNQQDKE